MKRKEFYECPELRLVLLEGGAIICGSPQADKDVEDMTESDNSIDDWY